MQEQFQKTPGGVFMPAPVKFIRDERARIGGRFIGQHVRDGKVIDEWDDHNLVVDQGLTSLLDVYLNAIAGSANWYLGLFEGNYTPVAADTAAVIAANSTETSTYTNSTRPAWTPAAASAKSITNSAARATFTFNATKTMYGGFLISSPTISGTAGVLFAAARFATSKAVVSTDQILLTYTFNASSV